MYIFISIFYDKLLWNKLKQNTKTVNYKVYDLTLMPNKQVLISLHLSVRLYTWFFVNNLLLLKLCNRAQFSLSIDKIITVNVTVLNWSSITTDITLPSYHISNFNQWFYNIVYSQILTYFVALILLI